MGEPVALALWATALTFLALSGLLWAEVRGDRRLRIVAKTLASTGFVTTGLVLAWPIADPFSRWVVAGLVLGLLGDVALLGRSRNAFAAGLGVFLAGHLAYLAAFVPRSEATVLGVLAAGSIAALGLWAFARRAGALAGPVALYSLTIAAMVGAGLGVEGRVGLQVGVVLFALSDMAVARQRFVQEDLRNPLIGLPLYYGGQLLIAWSLSS